MRKIKLTIKRNKPRVLLGIYYDADAHENSRYVLFITPKIPMMQRQTMGSKQPKSIQAISFCVRNTQKIIEGEISLPWMFEEEYIESIDKNPRLIVCAVIGKVLSRKQALNMLPETPIYQVADPNRPKAQEFNSRTWAADAFEKLKIAGAISGMDWRTAEGGIRAYRDQNKAEKYWSIAAEGRRVTEPRVPILDLLVGVEIRS
ncbi:hypothetical protein N7495_000022 [Penicillium taxi]|uniref:uncharacterized protein n=1 Tax=Penicillium taxi TaxID=168475 RepID=UPI0025455251|nr:uncharacterized protein N7495_000022 [Penicillium taxi]KAJ5907340.1 hypothetical protein N7495_000022 [Penicillium taxi]